MKTIKKLAKTLAQTPLERGVLRIVNRYAEDYDAGVAGFLDDLAQGGCQSGLVTELITYDQTGAFFAKHRREIGQLLSQTLSEADARHPGELFRNWDKEDPLAQDYTNQNILAWFGFEETARRLAAKAGLEI
jgi:predicted PP-loop superfamily ATPase